MSVYPSELEVFGSANMPEADGVTIGGAVDFTKRIGFADATVTAAVDVVSSSGSDTATKLVYTGLGPTGQAQSETLTLNGTTIVTGTKSLARYLYAATSNASVGGPLTNPGGTTAAGDVALIQHTRTIAGHTAQAGSANHTGTTPPLFKLQAADGASVAQGMVIRITGGTGPSQLRRIIGLPAVYGTDTVAVNADWGTIPDATSTYDIAPGMLFEKTNPGGAQTTAVIREFAAAAANATGGSAITYYEKLFFVNGDTATDLTTASVLKQVDPAGLYATGGALDFALCSSLNDAASVINRQTAPASGITAFSSGAAPQSIAVPASPGSLPSGAAPNAAGAQGFWPRLTVPAGMAPLNGAGAWLATGTSV